MVCDWINAFLLDLTCCLGLCCVARPSVVLTMIEVNGQQDTTICRAVSSLTTDCTLISSNVAVTVVFVCTATGSTPLVVQLFKNAKLLRQVNASDTLINKIHSPSSGIYQCVATNQYGSQQTSMYLQLKGRNTQ